MWIIIYVVCLIYKASRKTIGCCYHINCKNNVDNYFPGNNYRLFFRFTSSFKIVTLDYYVSRETYCGKLVVIFITNTFFTYKQINFLLI